MNYETFKKLKAIFKKYSIASDGMVDAIADLSVYDISKDEIRRICKACDEAKDFHEIWENYGWWKDCVN